VDLEAWAGFVSSVALAISLAACTGLRAWLPLLLGGILARLHVIELGPSFGFLASNSALTVFALASAIEIAADKIPALDHALDTLSTVIRPAAGSLLAASVLWKIADPLVALALGTALGAPASFIPHAAKSALRAASSTVTLGVANPVLSLAEDALTLLLVALAILVPLLVAAAFVAAAVFLLRRRLGRSAEARA
jgi:hypothetical protein